MLKALYRIIMACILSLTCTGVIKAGTEQDCIDVAEFADEVIAAKERGVLLPDIRTELYRVYTDVNTAQYFVDLAELTWAVHDQRPLLRTDEGRASYVRGINRGCMNSVKNVLSRSELQIKLIPPSKETRILYGELWRIYLDGPIDSFAPERLEKELIENSVGHSFVYLNSPGGDLSAGIRLGRLFRKYSLSTYVGRFDNDKTAPGYCFSACPFSFVGGYFRYLDGNSVLGIHRFTKETQDPSDIELAQITSGEITSYLSEMGVDISLFDKMTRIDNDDIYQLSVEETEKWQVANNGRQPAQWSIELVKRALYLKGEQKAWYGTGKAIFLCDKGRVFFTPMYEAGSNVDNIIKYTTRHSLRIGEEFLPIELSSGELNNINGYVMGSFYLNEPQLDFIRNAESIGYAAHSGNPGLFWGFDVDVGPNKEKIRNFLSSCEMRV